MTDDLKFFFYQRDSCLTGLDIYQNELFVTDWGPKHTKCQSETTHIYRIGKNGTITATVQVNGKVKDVRVYAEESIHTEAESVSTNTKFIIAVCVVGAVVGIAVIIALVFAFKRIRRSNPEEYAAFMQRQNTPEIPLESLASTSNALPSSPYEEFPSSQSGDRDGNSNNAGDTSFNQSVRNGSALYLTPTGLTGADTALPAI
ncbi:uncharacterized protein LOC112556956 [Pomacea canaliculata]|uniref:uncharacterized protein LOC112556956 n=1 Tax=Pomacea canaliculata TaxID=400727 RepID=UPI000D72C1BC|nr:uncharacterized protein LOC112556956 [Pomacea canaliculata]